MAGNAWFEVVREEVGALFLLSWKKQPCCCACKAALGRGRKRDWEEGAVPVSERKLQVKTNKQASVRGAACPTHTNTNTTGSLWKYGNYLFASKTSLYCPKGWDLAGAGRKKEA